jgi:hypothetical protein
MAPPAVWQPLHSPADPHTAAGPLQGTKLTIHTQVPLRHSPETGYGVYAAIRFGRVQYQEQLNAAARSGPALYLNTQCHGLCCLGTHC